MNKLKYIIFPALLLLIGIILYPNIPGLGKMTPELLLDRVAKSEKKSSYEAIQLHSYSSSGKMKRYLVYVVRDGCKLTWKAEGYEDHSETVPACWIGGERLISLIKKNYKPLIEGEDKIAGRDVWTLRLKPNNRHFPWKQLWIDKRTFVILATRDWSSENKIKNTMRTIKIVYTQPTADDQNVTDGQNSINSSYSGTQNSVKPLKNASANYTFLPRYVPAGFELTDIYPATAKAGRQAVYSDGLFSISIFTAPSKSRKTEKSISDWGRGKQVDMVVKGTHVVIIADLPSQEIQKIAASIH